MDYKKICIVSKENQHWTIYNQALREFELLWKQLINPILIFYLAKHNPKLWVLIIKKHLNKPSQEGTSKIIKQLFTQFITNNTNIKSIQNKFRSLTGLERGSLKQITN